MNVPKHVVETFIKDVYNKDASLGSAHLRCSNHIHQLFNKSLISTRTAESLRTINNNMFKEGKLNTKSKV